MILSAEFLTETRWKNIFHLRALTLTDASSVPDLSNGIWWWWWW